MATVRKNPTELAHSILNILQRSKNTGHEPREAPSFEKLNSISLKENKEKMLTNLSTTTALLSYMRIY